MEYKSEKRNCQNCKNDFVIESDDFGFYEKIKVPPPTFCPECRRQRRLAWRNDLSFYNRECDLCKKKIISLHHSEKPVVVYCTKCWWSDKWDPAIYGQDFDFSKTFFEQWQELQKKVPMPALFNDDGVGSINSEYTQNMTFAKNCYMVSHSWYVEDSMYSYAICGPETRDVVDGLDIFNYSQLIHDSCFLEHCYDCQNCYYSTGLTECRFCYDCKGCSNCFMCVNLRQKSYCILNKQYSKEEYEEKIKKYKLDTYTGRERTKKEFNEFLSKQIRRFANIRNSISCTGDGLFNCKNTRGSFMARGCDNMHFLMRGNVLKDCYDITPGGESSECYESLTADNDYRTLFSIYTLKSQDMDYTENCHSSKYIFGSSGIKHGEYFILNKKYSKDDYFLLRDKIIEHMKETREYGEFFPASISHFGYNETMAQEYFPLIKEQALVRGYKWWDKIQKTTGKETLLSDRIPDSISEINDNFINEVLGCIECGRNYKVIQNELIFYKKHNIPIPRKCFFCRNSDRIKLENPFKLWHRQCMNTGCSNKFETSYATERPEMVYCESCYNKEVY